MTVEDALVGFRPTPWAIYGWDAKLGFSEKPIRVLTLPKLKPKLLHVAFYEETPTSQSLGMVLNATSDSQTEQDYYKYFDGFDPSSLQETLPVTVEGFYGHDRARWLITCPLPQKGYGVVYDQHLLTILQWHVKTMETLRKTAPVFETTLGK